jgi:hypothetical protein
MIPSVVSIPIREVMAEEAAVVAEAVGPPAADLLQLRFSALAASGRTMKRRVCPRD